MPVYGDPLLQSAARKTRSKSSLAHEVLRDAIISLKLRPGTRIDKAEICERLGVSRQPLSEALARLAHERLVAVEPQKGTYVTRISLGEVEEAAFVREALEVATIRRVASGMDDETLDRLRLIVEYQTSAAAAGNHEEFYRLDVHFHATLFSCLALRRAAEVVESSRAQTERVRRLLVPTERNRATIDEHNAIVKALAARNPERAATAMRTHLGNVMRDLHKYAARRPELFQP
jgi:DNA-binding GntR family transcriptional regulator